MPRFVLLRHDCPPEYREGPHWDLMLEAEEGSTCEEAGLTTWSLLKLPLAWRSSLTHAYTDGYFEPTGNVEATELAPHRVAYLDYEGPVSDHPQFGPRGQVRRDLAGDYQLLKRDHSAWSIGLTSPAGGVLRVSLVLSKGNCWQLTSGN